MPKKTSPDLVAERVTDELHKDAIELGKSLEGEIGGLGARQMAKGDMLEIVARNWDDPRPIWGSGPNKQDFRHWLLMAQGPTNLVHLVEEAAKRGLLVIHNAQPSLISAPPAMPPTLAVNPQPPQLPGPLVGAMTNANG